VQRRQFLMGSMACGWTSAQGGSLEAAQRPALIPYPKRVLWTAEAFDCGHYEMVAPAEAEFARAELERTLSAAGAQQRAGAAKIVLRMDPADGAGKVGAEESYSLDVTTKGVVVTAPKPAGLWRGVTTLRQLLIGKGEHPAIAGCQITDWPAFAWRGFMHDVGRNYQDLALLKQFVDVMAQYKMNVFHFHLTDGPGYRVECRVHPELNAPGSYLPKRHPGEFYTYAELNDFIRYCGQRHIMVVPEIDMPGHSEYFKRAFGFDMQDERGIKIVEDVLNEFMDRVDTPFLHVGSDEVDVRNPRFMDHVTKLVRGRGRQVLAWRPGNPPSDKFVSQIWSYGPALDTLQGIPMVDSRNNYINHVDPFQGPPRLLNLPPGGKAEGDDMVWGGILCHWPDINVGTTMNIYRQSPVFPCLLAAAENYWRGHMPQHPQYWAHLPERNSAEYARYVEFETRLLEHRNRYFAGWPFPYLKQTNIPWKLIGPFDHKGDIAAAFPPEREIHGSCLVDGKTYRWMDAVGATIAVNHHSYDGWLPKVRRGTVYALTYIWTERARTVGFWIGFNGPSRSTRRGEPNPQQDEWSTVGSKVWINGLAVRPPVWKQPGPVADAEEVPLVDEDYFYRPPTAVKLQPGWNKVLIKAPKTEKAWTWLFTCVPVQVDGDRVREVEGLRFSAQPST
jgi:hexosaminidase